jgi:DNA-binding HxlR family transcriptional regulator
VKKPQRRSDCPIHFALEAFGDSWTLLIVRDLMFKDRTTYTELLRAEEGIATNILADRLVRLERDGIIERDDQRTSGGYRLTAKGIDLLPIMLEVISWSAKHDPSTAAPRAFVRRIRADRGALELEIRAGLRDHAKRSEVATTGPRAVNTARAAPLRGRRQRKESST